MEIQAKARIAITFTIGLLLLASLACNQAGEILTPAEATARAAPSPTPTRPVEESESEGEGAPAGIQLVGKLYLVSLMDGPGSTHMIAGQERGVDVVIIGAAEHEGESWYEIDAPTGEGWVPAENLQVPEGAADSEGAPAGPQAGDTVYLAPWPASCRTTRTSRSRSSRSVRPKARPGTRSTPPPAGDGSRRRTSARRHPDPVPFARSA